jgi:hypothetical protein
MNTCKNPKCESIELVYSGTDAFMLGIPTEQICYDCANTYAHISRIVDQWKESFAEPVTTPTTSD